MELTKRGGRGVTASPRVPGKREQIGCRVLTGLPLHPHSTPGPDDLGRVASTLRLDFLLRKGGISHTGPAWRVKEFSWSPHEKAPGAW